MIRSFFARTFICVAVSLWMASCSSSSDVSILVFSKTEGFRHQSIEAGKAALSNMADEKGFVVTFTEDAAQFTESNLKKYNAVIFLNTTGDVLDNEQQISFERYIQAGGGYVGVHSATDTEYEWPWYGALAGAYFLNHPSDPSNVQKGKFTVTTKDHWATAGMEKTFEWSDEFYSFRNISPKINVLLEIDDSSYIGGENPDYHPMSWYQEFDGGRSFYTALGHVDEAYTEPFFLNHLWGGIRYAIGGDNPTPVDFAKSRPEENRFTKIILAEKLDEPMELTILDDSRVLFIQRKGEVLLFNTKTNELKTIAKIPVSTHYVNKEGKESMGEDGLLGLNKDPNFSENNWIYLYYSIPEEPRNVLARFELRGDQLIMDSKRVMLEVPVQREECCHTGGSIAWDKDGNLYLSTGDNTNPHASNGYSPSDERAGRGPWDAQKSSANTNDLRGKIIRIHPEPDGTYTVPAGNLFPRGTEKTRPEIYTMGHRNPFRISVDQRTGYVYWGDVGPDAAKADSTRGPAGHDEVGQARKPGNFGWPHFVGDNKAYFKYDFAANRSGALWDEKEPLNQSPNNTGLEKLPPAQKAFIWYPYSESPEFPLTGTGGRNAMAGPVFYSDDFKGAERAFPKYYDKKLFTYDWMRGWIMSVTMDEQGNLVSMERFMPSYKFSNPMDMAFAANGDLYMLEYGTGWFTQNDDARLIRIEYNGGNRKPQVQIAANKMGGAAPMDLQLNSEGTSDADGDELRYTWAITSENGYSEEMQKPEAAVTLSEPGVYTAMLSVDDGNGGLVSQSMQVTVGNEPPALSLQIPNGNRSFYMANQDFQYDVDVTDKEDGTLGTGIEPERVSVSIDYLPEGYDQVTIAQGHRSADASALVSAGRKLIDGSDCKACHDVNKKSIGPTYRQVAAKYKGDDGAIELLTKKIISGGSGVWGETAMAAHPDISTADASEMVKYILSLANTPATPSLPLEGSYNAALPQGDKGRGVFIVRAAYEDNGANGLPSMMSEETLILRNANMNMHGFDVYQDVNKMSFGGNDLVIPAKSGAYIALKQVDLKNISSINVMASAPKAQLNALGGKVEMHLDSPTGPLVGESEFLEASEKTGFTPSLLRIPVDAAAVSGDSLHDVYLVFVNPSGESGSLMVVVATQFALAGGQ